MSKRKNSLFQSLTIFSIIGLIILAIALRDKIRNLFSSSPMNLNGRKAKIRTALINYGYPEIYAGSIEKLAKFETGDFDSDLFGRTKNLFSMGVPSNRESNQDSYIIADGERKFATFKSEDQAIDDLMLWIQYRDAKLDRDPKDPDESFINFLESRNWLGRGRKMDSFRQAFQSWE